MKCEQIKEMLLKTGFAIKSEVRLPNETGTQFKLENGAIVNCYDTGTYNVQGKQAHDTRLVAAMERHGVRYLLTFNTSDFARFPKIVAHSPAEIMTGIALT